MMISSVAPPPPQHALMPRLETRLTTGIASCCSFACSSRSTSACPVTTPGCTDGGIFGYLPTAHSSLHGSPMSVAAVPMRTCGARPTAKRTASEVPAAATAGAPNETHCEIECDDALRPNTNARQTGDLA